MRRSSTRRIDGMCSASHIEKEGAYKQGKWILEIYQDICWNTIRGVDCVREELAGYYSADVTKALIYLETFASDEQKDHFESRVEVLFSNHMMASMIDMAVARIRSYPADGKLYYDILCMCYLNRGSMKESEILEVLGLERSAYYKRKKEAIIVFDIVLHDVIFERKAELQKNKEEASLQPLEVAQELPLW